MAQSYVAQPPPAEGLSRRSGGPLCHRRGLRCAGTAAKPHQTTHEFTEPRCSPSSLGLPHDHARQYHHPPSIEGEWRNGRRRGLKIPCPVGTCGFDSRLAQWARRLCRAVLVGSRRYASTNAQTVCSLPPSRRSKRLRDIASLLWRNVSLYSKNGIKTGLAKQLGRDYTASAQTNPPALLAIKACFSKIPRILQLPRNLGRLGPPPPTLGVSEVLRQLK